MSEVPGSYIGARLEAITREHLVAERLHSLLVGVIDKAPMLDPVVKGFEGIPISTSWTLAITDAPEAVETFRFTTYREHLLRPIRLSFWPAELNPVYQAPPNSDGPKLWILVARNGVLDETIDSWHEEDEIDALDQDIVRLLPAADQD